MGKIRWYTGTSPLQRRRDAMQRVYELLPVDGSRITFSNLKRLATEEGLSSATLSRHLKELVGKGVVAREVDPSSRPPAVRYKLVRRGPEKGAEDILDRFLLDAGSLDLERMAGENPELAEQLIEVYFKFNMEWAAFSLLQRAAFHIEKLKREKKIDMLKSAPDLFAARKLLYHMIGDELDDWFAVGLRNIMLDFIEMVRLHDDLVSPIMARVEAHYERGREKEGTAALELLNKIPPEMMWSHFFGVGIHASVAANRQMYIMVRSVLIGIHRNGDVGRIQHCGFHLKELEEEWSVMAFPEAEGTVPVILNAAKLGPKTEEEGMLLIARTLAHIALDHQNVRPEEEEKEADKLARLWLPGIGRP